MARTYGAIGSERKLLELLRGAGGENLSSLEDIVWFLEGYQKSVDVIPAEVTAEYESELGKLETEYSAALPQSERIAIESEEKLVREIETLEKYTASMDAVENQYLKILAFLPKMFLTMRLEFLQDNFNTVKNRPVMAFDARIDKLKTGLETLRAGREGIIRDRVTERTGKLELVKKTIEGNASLRADAYGERKAAAELEKLPDGYSVINGYFNAMKKPIQEKDTDRWIYAIDVDHIVIGPPGIFLVDTAGGNPADTDLANLAARLAQMQWALYVLLNQAAEGKLLPSFAANWHLRKIEPQPVILYADTIPSVQIPGAAILHIDTAAAFFTQGKPVFSPEDVESITAYLNKT